MTTRITLPTLGYLRNGNGWLGSAGLLRFEIEKPQDGEMTAVLWQGPFSRPYAPELAKKTFPVTEDGVAAAVGYLTAQAEAVNAAPPFSPEETTAFYQAKKAEEGNKE